MFNLFPKITSKKNIGATINKFYKKYNIERDDTKAIAKDWKTVGKDMRKYIR